MNLLSLLLILQTLSGSRGQQPGTQKPDQPVPFVINECTEGKCEPKKGALVIDTNWRWIQSGGTNCYTGNQWNAKLCPTGEECAKNCAVEGADYEQTYGVKPVGENGVSLKFVTQNSNGPNTGSRLYFLDTEGQKYHMFKLKNKQFSFDVNVSNLPCGVNGALYFSAMDADGGMSQYPGNKAGAPWGTGYCDAQCPQDVKFIGGKANSEGWVPTGADTGNGNMGSCCPEVDIWEANSISQAFTPHTCSVSKPTICTGVDCGSADGERYKGLCDKDGCDFASNRLGATKFYGKGMQVDSSKDFTVVTQFITDDNTDKGQLVEIRRFYVQDGKTIPNSVVTVKGLPKPVNSITDNFCKAHKKLTGDFDAFTKNGGLKSIGNVLDEGMVLVVSIWDDATAKMQWLDGTYPPNKPRTDYGVARGTCPAAGSDPKILRAKVPDSSVVFSNVKVESIRKLGATPARRCRS